MFLNPLPTVDDNLPFVGERLFRLEWLKRCGLVWGAMMLRKRVRGKGVPDGWKGSDRSRGRLWTRGRRLPHALKRGLDHHV